jgi:diphthamide synthase (EF-2-diphthine--ammonia ligase)
MVEAGLRACLTCVDPKKLPASYAGRIFDSQFLRDLPPGVDPCGENGEFHTLAYAGPMFRESLRFQAGEVVERDGFIFADLLPARETRDPAKHFLSPERDATPRETEI